MIALCSVLAAITATIGILSARGRLRWRGLALALGSGALTITVLAGLSSCIGGSLSLAAVELGSGAAPLAAGLVASAVRVRAAQLVICAGVVVPVGLWLPELSTVTFGGDGAAVHDFGGALGLVIGPAALVLTASRSTAWSSHQPTSARQRVALGVTALAFVVWLAASEGAIDVFTGEIALAAAVGIVAGWLGCELGFRLNDRKTRRRPLIGGLVGASVVLPSATVLDPLALGILAAFAGAIVGAARAACEVPALACLTGATTGLIAIGLVSDDFGFVQNARVDVLAAQLGAIVVMSLVGASAGTAIRLGERMRIKKLEWAIPDSNR